MITFEDDITASREQVYDAFLAPEGLRVWHRASDDWTTPHAEVDPQVGGRFNIGYGDPTGENTFDFTGAYTELDRPNRIAYTIDDGRKVEVEFTDASPGVTHVKWSFEPEGEFPEEMQRDGWAGQLTNLKRYLETD
jgi:uncharacterized protein YndB with AHSA1/START domain